MDTEEAAAAATLTKCSSAKSPKSVILGFNVGPQLSSPSPAGSSLPSAHKIQSPLAVLLSDRLPPSQHVTLGGPSNSSEDFADANGCLSSDDSEDEGLGHGSDDEEAGSMKSQPVPIPSSVQSARATGKTQRRRPCKPVPWAFYDEAVAVQPPAGAGAEDSAAVVVAAAQNEANRALTNELKERLRDARADHETTMNKLVAERGRVEYLAAQVEELRRSNEQMQRQMTGMHLEQAYADAGPAQGQQQGDGGYHHHHHHAGGYQPPDHAYHQEQPVARGGGGQRHGGGGGGRRGQPGFDGPAGFRGGGGGKAVRGGGAVQAGGAGSLSVQLAVRDSPADPTEGAPGRRSSGRRGRGGGKDMGKRRNPAGAGGAGGGFGGVPRGTHHHHHAGRSEQRTPVLV